MTSKLKDLVHEALDNALDNGSFEKSGELYNATHEEIAEDMVQYDSELENYEPDALIPHIETWWHKV